MSRVNLESRQTYQFFVFRRHTYGVSDAAWPLCVRRSVSTSRAAQRRRLCIIAILSWLNVLKHWRHKVYDWMTAQPLRRQILRMSIIAACSCAAFLLLSIFDRPVLLHHWSALLVFVFLCVLTTRVAVYQIFPEQQRPMILPVISSDKSVAEGNVGSGVEQLPVSEWGQPVLSGQAKQQAEVWIPSSQLGSFPDTPMPVPPTPLVRVLETIDLSSSGIEHFIDTKPQSSSLSIVVEQERLN